MAAVRASSGTSRKYIVFGSIRGFVHRIGKDARRELVELLVQAVGSVKGAAEKLGVSRQAVHEFLSGKTHPRDELVEKILEILSFEHQWFRKRALEVLHREMEVVVEGYAAVMELLGPSRDRDLEDYL
ncbi:MAG: helix-turn-helix domain-containing protein [Desulfurococcales archaeon]|nr:helix-turn-helix domain-containing protein [Desulfurococcales archaeon]